MTLRPVDDASVVGMGFLTVLTQLQIRIGELEKEIYEEITEKKMEVLSLIKTISTLEEFKQVYPNLLEVFIANQRGKTGNQVLSNNLISIMTRINQGKTSEVEELMKNSEVKKQFSNLKFIADNGIQDDNFELLKDSSTLTREEYIGKLRQNLKNVPSKEEKKKIDPNQFILNQKNCLKKNIFDWKKLGTIIPETSSNGNIFLNNLRKNLKPIITNK